MRPALAAGMLSLLWLACNAPLTPAPTPTRAPTYTPEPTRTATPRPSSTPHPTASPSPFPFRIIDPALSPTPVFVLVSPSPTATGALPLDCRLNWQSPVSGIGYKPDTKFAVGWKVTNIGTTPWGPGAVEFSYLGGARLHNDAVVQLRANVLPGQSVILSVAMRAPHHPSIYTTHWSLRRGDTIFCRVSLTVYVK